jgi:hypothetical protein
MITILGAIACVVGAGAWLRWATIPVTIAYAVGRQTERLCARRRGSQAQASGTTRPTT